MQNNFPFFYLNNINKFCPLDLIDLSMRTTEVLSLGSLVTQGCNQSGEIYKLSKIQKHSQQSLPYPHPHSTPPTKLSSLIPYISQFSFISCPPSLQCYRHPAPSKQKMSVFGLFFVTQFLKAKLRLVFTTF